MATTRIQSGGVTAQSITHDKLHTDMNLSTKTVVLPSLSQTLVNSSHLQLGGNLDVVGQIGAYDNSGTAWGKMILRATDFELKNAGGTIKLTLDTSGNVYIKGVDNITTTAGNTNLQVLTTNSQGADLGGSIGMGGVYHATNQITFAEIHGKKQNSTTADLKGYMSFVTRDAGGSTEKMRITPGGALGLGVIPGVWSSNYPALQIGQGATFTGHRSNTQTQLAQNWWVGTGNQYVVNGAASRLLMGADSTIEFSQAPSGTAGATMSTINTRLIIKPSGDVGIGTDAPLSKLHVRDGSAQAGISHTYIYDGSAISVEGTEPGIQLMAEDSGTHGGSILWRYGNNAFAAIANPTTDAIDFTYGVSTANDFQVHSGTNMSSYKKIMSIGADGNVGIGTDDPDTTLELGPVSALVGPTLRLSGGTGGQLGIAEYPFGTVEFFSNDPSGDGAEVKASISGLAHTGSTDPGGEIAFSTTNSGTSSTLTERFRLTHDGNVGIATDDPKRALQIGATGSFPISFNGNYPDIHMNTYYESGWRIHTAGFGAKTTFNGATGAFGFSNVASTQVANANFTPLERLTILANGNVGIGATTPEQNLHIRRASGSDTGGAGHILFDVADDAGPAYALRMGDTADDGDFHIDRRYAGAWYSSLAIDRATGRIHLSSRLTGGELGNSNIVRKDLHFYVDFNDKACVSGTSATEAPTDLSSQGYNLTLHGGANFEYKDGIGTYYFDGSDDHININDFVVADASNTYEVWHWSNSQSGWETFWDSGTERPLMGIIGDQLRAYPSGTNFATIDTGKWYHIVFAFNNNNDLDVYVNGKRVTEAHNWNHTQRTGTFTFWLGGDTTHETTNGYIGVARAYTRQLTPAEVLQNYNAEVSRFAVATPSLGMVHSDGNVGIGTNNPIMPWSNHKGLHIKTAEGASDVRLEKTVSGSTTADWVIRADDAGDFIFRNNMTTKQPIVIDGASGNVGVNNTDPSSSLTVNGTLALHDANGTYGLSITESGVGKMGSGEINLVQGWSGTLTAGDTLVFTYNKVSWAAYGFEIEGTNAGRWGKIEGGGYSNGGPGLQSHTNVGTLFSSFAITSTSGNSQGLVMTMTLSGGVHTVFRIRYFQGGGDGVPIPSRATLVLNS